MQTKFDADSPSLVSPGLLEARSRFGLLLGRVYRQWRREVDLSFKELGLSDATRMPLLALYVQAEPMRQKDLADVLYLDTSSLVRVLEQLRKAQLVDWDSDPADRRTKCIVLTPDGRKAAALILARSLEIEQAILSSLSLEEQGVTRQSLEKISQRFDELAGRAKEPVAGIETIDPPACATRND